MKKLIRLRRILKPPSAKWLILAWTIFLLVAATLVWIKLPEWLTGGESASTTNRNLGLIIAAVVGLPLAVWRSLIAERQAETAQHHLLNERFHKGAEMLGHPQLRSVRLGGIYALAGLSSEHPESFHLQVMQLFAAFVVSQTATGETVGCPGASMDSQVPGTGHEDEGGHESTREVQDDFFEIAESKSVPGSGEEMLLHLAAKGRVPNPPALVKDVQEAVRFIAERNNQQIDLETREGFRLNLAHASLAGLTLREANFSNVNFTQTNLRRVKLWGARFSNCVLQGADLTAADLTFADLRNTDMRRVNLTAAKLTGANLQDADLGLVDLASENLWKGRIFPSKLVHANLMCADLRGVDLGSTDLRNAMLGGATLDRADLSGANLTAADLRAASLVGTNLSGAKLRNANLGGAGANLSDADLAGADMTDANLGRANLKGAIVEKTNLSGADFAWDYRSRDPAPATGLRQGQLDRATANRNQPPVLDGVLDCMTNEPLVWAGRSIDIQEPD